MKLKLLLALFFPLLLLAQQNNNALPKKSTAHVKKANSKVVPIPDALKNKKTMTPDELAKLGIELPGTWFTITGNVTGLKDSTQVFLASMNDGKSLAQGVSLNGQFKLRGQVDHEGLCVMSFAGYNDFLTLFMANDSIAVTGDANHIGALTIKGAPMEDDFVMYRQGFDAENRRLSELLQRINAAQQATTKDSLKAEYTKIVLTQADTFLIKKPASPVACFVLSTVAGLLDNVSELEQRFDKLMPEAKRGIYAELIKRKINENKVNPVGTEAPDFTQNNASGKPVSLRSFRGHYVLIHFWAGWSKQCKGDILKLVPIYEQYNKRNFSIIGISLDSDKDIWQKAVADNKMKWPQLSDLKYWENEIAFLYKIESIPQNILVGPDGKILDKNISPAQLEAKLALLCK